MHTLVKDLWVPEEVKFAPKTDLGLYIKKCLVYLPGEMAAELVQRISRIIVLESRLYGRVFWANGKVENLGLLGQKVITDLGVAFLVDAWQNIVELEIMKYHALGTGSTAENQTDTTLVTELTTEYAGDVRATGSLTEGATANIFRSIGTNTLDGNPSGALREHGIFSQAATGGGVLWDRTVYAAVTLSNGDSFQTTYDMTATAGG